MSLGLALVILACAVVAFCAIYLVWHPDYKCGPVGVAGLAMLCLAAVGRGAVILERWRNDEIAGVSSVAFLTWFGLALFLACVVCRFYRRTRRAGATWYDVA